MDTTLAAGFAAAFFAGVTQGLTGFGSAIVFVSFMVLFMDPKDVVPVMLFLALAINMLVIVEARRHVQLQRIWPLMAAGACGLWPGRELLVYLPTPVLKAGIGAIITVFALLLMSGWRRTIRNERAASVAVGFFSGFFNAGAGMSGPPVILFFSNQNMPKDVFRANIVAYFLVLNACSIVVFWSGGLITPVVLHRAGLFVIALAAGGGVGIALTKKLNEQVFKRIALGVVTVAGLLAVASGVRALL
jgi:hypothetical protein